MGLGVSIQIALGGDRAQFIQFKRMTYGHPPSMLREGSPHQRVKHAFCRSVIVTEPKGSSSGVHAEIMMKASPERYMS